MNDEERKMKMKGKEGREEGWEWRERRRKEEGGGIRENE